MFSNDHKLIYTQMLDKQRAYWAEAETRRKLPKYSFRRLIALLLRTWAESLEPSSATVLPSVNRVSRA